MPPPSIPIPNPPPSSNSIPFSNPSYYEIEKEKWKKNGFYFNNDKERLEKERIERKRQEKEKFENKINEKGDLAVVLFNF